MEKIKINLNHNLNIYLARIKNWIFYKAKYDKLYLNYISLNIRVKELQFETQRKPISIILFENVYHFWIILIWKGIENNVLKS